MRDGWTETTLGEISDFVSARVMPELLSSAVPYVGLEHIDSRSPLIYRTGNVESVTSSVTPFESEDVLFGRLRPYLHKVAFAQFDGVCTPEVLVLRSKEVCSPKFLHFLCSMDSTISRCVEMSAGTRMPRTGAADLASVTVLLPPLEEQRRIVDVVASVDTYIDALKDKVAKARTARNAVLHELLSAGGPDWTETTLGEIGEQGMFVDGDWVESKDQDPNGDFRLIQLADIGDGTFLNKSSRFMNAEQFTRLRCTPLEPMDILIARMPDPIARACLVPENLPTSATVVDVAILRCQSREIASFLVLAINGATFRRAAQSLLTGTTRQRVSRTNLSKIDVCLPPPAEQRRIVDIISSMDEVIVASEKAVAEAVRLRSGLLSDLLSGEHEIPASYDSLLGAA